MPKHSVYFRHFVPIFSIVCLFASKIASAQPTPENVPAILSFLTQPEPGEPVTTGTVIGIKKEAGAAGFFDHGEPMHWTLTLQSDDKGTKVVCLLTPRTLIFTRGGQWRGFNSIQAGQKVSVMGPTSGEPNLPYPTRIILLPDDAPNLKDEPLFSEPKASEALWQGKDGNLTMRVTRAGWFDRKQFAGAAATNKAPVFGLTCELYGPPPRQGAGYGLRLPLSGLLRSAQVLDRPLAMPFAANNSNSWRGSSEGVDPQWDKMTIQVEVLDPLAPEGVDGIFRGLLEWENIALPDKRGPVEVHRTQTTALGTEVTLESLNIRAKNTVCKFRIKLSPRIAELDLSPRQMRDDQNRVSRLSGGGESGDNSDDGTELFIEQTNVGAPAQNAKTVSLTFLSVESAPNLADPRWMRHFRFSISPRALHDHAFGPPMPQEWDWGGSPEVFDAAILARAQSENVVGELEAVPFDWNNQRGWRLWLAPKNVWNKRSWKVRAVRVRGGAREIPASLNYSSDEPHFLKANGAWTASDERSDRIAIEMPAQAPKSVKIEADIELFQRLQHQEHGQWPVPAPDQKSDLKPQKTENANKNDFFQPVSLTAFKTPADLPSLPLAWRARFSGPGLALVVQISPQKGHTPGNYTLHALDATGANLVVDPPYGTEGLPGDATQKLPADRSASVNTITFLLRAPRQGGSFVETWLYGAETRSLGEMETLKFAPINSVERGASK